MKKAIFSPKSMKSALSMRCLTAAWACAVLATTGSAGAVGTRHFVIESGADFSKGETEGTAVDSSGILRPGLELGQIDGAESDSVWAALKAKAGLYLATGNEGKLLLVNNGAVRELASSEGMALTSMVEAFGGRVIVAQLPGSELLELKDGKLVPFVDLAAEVKLPASDDENEQSGAAQAKDGATEPVQEHVWSLSYDSSTKALYAATGPFGRLYRVTADGTAQLYFDSEQGHVMSVLARSGKVYCGTSETAQLFEITGPGRAQVLYDFGPTEVRGLELGQDGSLYAIVNELKGSSRADSIKKDQAGAPRSSSAQAGSGKLFRFDPQGRPELLFESSEDHFASLALGPSGLPLVGTGAEGKLIRVDADHGHTILADVPERQVSAVLLSETNGKAQGWVVASDPLVVHPVLGTGGSKAVWTSAVLDAGIRARLGRIDWDAQGPVELSVRSGGTQLADKTWTDWGPVLRPGKAATTAQNRYFQVRAKLLAAGSAVSRIDVPYVTDNLRATLTSVKVKSGARTAGTEGVASSGQPIDKKPSAKIEIAWKVDNPDKDPLRYRIEYRRLDETTWHLAHLETEIISGSSWDWDTRDLAEGRYRVRVKATDELANPVGRVSSHSMESEILLVDNTPPRLTGLRVAGGKLVGVATDRVGPIRRLELRVAGTRQWIPIEPSDGIFDQTSESFSLPLSQLSLEPKASVTVRAFDTAGNAELAHLPVSR